MTEERALMLATIRNAIGRPVRSESLRSEIRTRIANPKPSIIPERVNISAEEKVDLFCNKAETVAATVVHLAAMTDVPAAVSEYLREQNLAPDLTVAPDPALKDLPWADQPLLEVNFGLPARLEAVGLSMAFAGAAETGTLLAKSGEHSPTTLNFLPEHHLILLKKSQIYGAYEEIWALLRKKGSPSETLRLPRTLNMITGPSRTGDIALKIELGAHGPKNLHIMIIDD